MFANYAGAAILLAVGELLNINPIGCYDSFWWRSYRAGFIYTLPGKPAIIYNPWQIKCSNPSILYLLIIRGQVIEAAAFSESQTAWSSSCEGIPRPSQTGREP